MRSETTVRSSSLDAQDLAGLALEHQPAAGRGGDDVVPGPRVGRELRGQAAHVAAGGLVLAVALQRQAAAALLGDDHLEPVVLEHLRSPSRRCPARRSWRAAVEEDHLALGRGRVRRLAPAAGAVLEGAARPPRHRRLAVDAQDLLQQQAERAEARRPVGDRPTGAPIHARQRRARDQPVAQRHAALLRQLGLGLGVDLGDLHALRADLGADAAARAVVERVRRRWRRRRGSARPGARRTWGRGRAGWPPRPGSRSRRSCT